MYRHDRSRRLGGALLLLACSLLAAPAGAATYYMSPSGNDGASGTAQGSPWKTFTKAVAPLQAGDTLILLDGEYTAANCGSSGCGHGFLVISGKSGTATNPITIRAQNQYKAWIHDNGTYSAVTIEHSAYIVLDGLRLSTTTPNKTPCNPNGGCGALVSGSNAVYAPTNGQVHHITLRKLLIHDANGNANTHLVDMQQVMDSTFEDIELYNYHRHALALEEGSHRNTVRRVYCSSRYWPLLFNTPDPYPYPGKIRGQDCVAYYVGNDNLAENIIAEDSKKVLVNINRGDGDGGNRNRTYGSIGLNNETSFHDEARDVSTLYEVEAPYWENIVSVGGADSQYGLWDEGGYKVQVHRATMIGHDQGFAFNNPGYQTPASLTASNWLAVKNRSTDIGIPNEPGGFTLDSANAGSYNVNTSQGKITNQKNVDPKLGGCLIYIPDGSPMKGAGAGGKDIGANVLYQYVNGKETTEPLWDVATGRLRFCGPVIAGVNDSGAGHSCTDVHQRLHVGTSDCPFPQGYGGGVIQPPPASLPAPTHLRIVQP